MPLTSMELTSPPPPARVLSLAPTEITPRTPVKVTASVRSNYLPRGSPRAFWACPLAWPSPSGPLGRQRSPALKGGPEDRFCEAVRNDLRVPLTVEGADQWIGPQ